MCIVANECHLSNTQIFAAVCGYNKGQPTRQLVLYENKAHAPANNTHKSNFMCLPIPLADGLDPKEHISLYSFSSKDKPDKLKILYDEFFTILSENFDSKPVGRGLGGGMSRGDFLEVMQVGGYKCSFARVPKDVLNLDPDVFGRPVGLYDVVRNNYPKDFAFLVASFQQDPAKPEKFHPILYTHPIAENKRFFIPTRHYHGKGDPESTVADDWDHKIYVMGAKPTDLRHCVGQCQVKYPDFAVYEPREWRSLKHVEEVIKDAFNGSERDTIDLKQIYGKNCACKIEVKGKFDNIDLQPVVELNQ